MRLTHKAVYIILSPYQIIVLKNSKKQNEQVFYQIYLDEFLTLFKFLLILSKQEKYHEISSSRSEIIH